MNDLGSVQSAAEQLVGTPIAEIERDLILATLRQTRGNRTHAAKLLGLSVRTVRNKLAAYANGGFAVPEPH
jgi:Fis family transcriptional regulator